jgi:hypothetical protein
MTDDLLWRIPLLGVFLVAGVIYDRWRHGAEGRRAKEYTLLLGCGLLGALIGLLQDLISIRVSPDYFVVGKGIERDADFTRQVLLLGTYAGFIAGLVLGGLLLLVNQPRATRGVIGYRALLARGVPRTLGLAFLGVPLGLFIGPNSPLRAQVGRNLLQGDSLERFLQVWGMHYGLYGGAVLGVIWALVSVWRARPVVAAPEESPD